MEWKESDFERALAIGALAILSAPKGRTAKLISFEDKPLFSAPTDESGFFYPKSGIIKPLRRLMSVVQYADGYPR